MDLRDRIARRQVARRDGGVVVDRPSLSPAVHRAEPVGRGPVLERLLDAVEPAFDDDLPSEFAVVGPPGAGTSAVVTALFEELNTRLGADGGTIGTTTRGDRTGGSAWFLTVDARRVDSPFSLYHRILSHVSVESVPTSGIGTDALRGRLDSRLSRPNRRVVVAVDHHDDPETLSYARFRELLDPLDERVSTVAVGRSLPTDWDRTNPGETVDVPPYRRHELVDVLTERASTGLAAGSIDHDAIRTLAKWADGNAHDALVALLTAGILATADGDDRVRRSHLESGIADVPDPCVHIDRVLALSDTRTDVLMHLIDADVDDEPIRDVAAMIADRTSLTAGTVTRFLYELADRGILERVEMASESGGSGRRPSTLSVCVPPIASRVLTGHDGTDDA